MYITLQLLGIEKYDVRYETSILIFHFLTSVTK